MSLSDGHHMNLEQQGHNFLSDAAKGVDRYMDSSGSSDGSTAEDLSRDTKQAIQAGRNAVRGGKNAVKMGRQAASAVGKFQQSRVAASATSTAAKSAVSAGAKVVATATTKHVAIVAAIIVVMLVIVMAVGALMTLPGAIFESVQETWAEIKYTDVDAGNTVMNMARFVGASVKNVGSGIANAVKNIWDTVFNRSHDAVEEGYANEYDLKLAAQEASARLSIIKKAISANDKYKMRANQVKSAVDDTKSKISNNLYKMCSNHYDDWTNPDGYVWEGIHLYGSVEPLGTDKDSSPVKGPKVIEQLNAIIDEIEDASTLDELEEKNAKFTEKVNNVFPLNLEAGSNMTAISLMALSAAQQGNSLEEIKTSDFMRYLGYTAGGYNKTSFDIGHIDTSVGISGVNKVYGMVDAWTGAYKPQYLMEEMKYYQGQLALAKAQGDEEELERLAGIVDQYKSTGVSLVDLVVMLDFPNLNITTLSSTVREVSWTVSVSHSSYYLYIQYIYRYENPDGKGYIEKYEQVKEYHTATSSHVVSRNRWFNIYYYISPRSTNALIDMVGLWNGSFES